MGGDEFVLLLENISKIEDIKKIAEKINKALIKTYSKNDKDITISASIGITIIEENMSIKKFIKKLIKLLYVLNIMVEIHIILTMKIIKYF